MRIFVFYHIFTNGPFVPVMEEMMRICENTGFFADVETFYYSVVGHDLDSVRAIMDRYPKTRLFQWGGQQSIQEFERFTLHALYSFACKELASETDPVYILYIHSKGVSDKSRANGNVPFWRQTMLHALLAYRETCWTTLANGYDTISLFSRRRPAYHYSGNMWWTTDRYIRSLPVPIGPAYLDPEMWIGKHMQNSLCLYTGPLNLYQNRCPPIPEYQAHIHLSMLKSSDPSINPGVLHVCVPKIVSVECGIANEWYPCHPPSPTAETSSFMANLASFPLIHPAHEPPLQNRKKQFRFRLDNPTRGPITVLEGTLIQTPPAEKLVPVDLVSRCRIVVANDPDGPSYDATDKVDWQSFRNGSCALTNKTFGHDPFFGHVKRIVFSFHDHRPDMAFAEDTIIYLI